MNKRYIFLFDLDGTLYLDSHVKYELKLFDKRNSSPELFYLKLGEIYNKTKIGTILLNNLKKLKKLGEIYLFTNGNSNHALSCLKNMNIPIHSNCLKRIHKYLDQEYTIDTKNPIILDIISRDDFRFSLKPDYYPYFFVINHLKIIDSDEVYFFENSSENLNTSKVLGWKGIYIKDGHRDHEDSDVINLESLEEYITTPPIEWLKKQKEKNNWIFLSNKQRQKILEKYGKEKNTKVLYHDSNIKNLLFKIEQSKKKDLISDFPGVLF